MMENTPHRPAGVVPGVAAPSGIAPEISVVVPHLNQPDLLELCLASLAAQTLPADRFEVIIVDNGSQHLPEAEVARFPFARLVVEPTPGPGPARNRGVALAAAPVIAFLDSDCIADPGWLAALLAAFAAHPETTILGGKVVIFAAGPRPNVAEAFDLVYGIRQEVTIARHRFAATANLAVRREVFEAIGPFAGLAVSEDMEWGQRADAAGHPTRLAPDAVVRHPARDSMAALRKQWDRHVSHFWAMRPKTAKMRALWLVHAAAIAASPLAEIPRILASERLSGVRQRRDAFQGLAAMRLYRARRMLGEILDPAAGAGSARWNRS
ncbi:MAG TPA: glycosyltransferase family A protein [Amaricoccus sp.]|nr:glycosyltransferase family A protein [Amaricoccus sp.]